MSNSVRSDDNNEINSQLLALTETFSSGSIAMSEFRHRRRELICQFTGQDAPKIDDERSGEATQPGMPAVSASSVAQSPKVDADVPTTSTEKASPPSKAVYVMITVVTLLIAISGFAGLFWFIFRK